MHSFSCSGGALLLRFQHCSHGCIIALVGNAACLSTAVPSILHRDPSMERREKPKGQTVGRMLWLLSAGLSTVEHPLVCKQLCKAVAAHCRARGASCPANLTACTSLQPPAPPHCIYCHLQLLVIFCCSFKDKIKRKKAADSILLFMEGNYLGTQPVGFGKRIITGELWFLPASLPAMQRPLCCQLSWGPSDFQVESLGFSWS